MFNNPFVGYQQPQYYTPPLADNLTQMRMQPTSSIVWVQGEAGAKSYLVGAGQTVALWDSENTVIYIKSVDAGGVPSMRVLDYTERKGATAPSGDYVTRQEFNELNARLKSILQPKEDAEHGEPTV